MRLKAIEPTPSPNTMKLIVDEALENGNIHLKKGAEEEAPEQLKQLLQIDGVKSLYYVADFIALDRNPKYDWKPILAKAREVFGEVLDDDASNTNNMSKADFGEVNVFIQKFRGIPMQVKVLEGEEEHRFGLPDRFMDAILKAQASSDNVVMERQWIEQSARYGEAKHIGEEVVEEISAAYDQNRLDKLIDAAYKVNESQGTNKLDMSYKVTEEMLRQSDWRKRYAALEQMKPTLEDLSILSIALDDEKASIRRLATVYLGMLEDKAVMPYLEKALNDKTVTVRRTAGDCFSDLGYQEGIPIMINALKDKSKLVRWRAAMFLYEVGDESAIEALREAQDDPEFEVSLQVKMALERIQGGKEAKGSVWKQMTETFNKENN